VSIFRIGLARLSSTQEGATQSLGQCGAGHAKGRQGRVTRQSITTEGRS